MDYSVCSREFERDYTWDNSHASQSVAKYAQDLLAPAFEGSLTKSRFAALLRCPDSTSGVLLGVSVSTSRQDFTHRPIRTMAFLCATTNEETELLLAFFSECLRNGDENTIYNSESPVARAVESLYQNKNPNEFVKYCRSLHTVTGGNANLSGRRAIPRNDANSRNGLAESLQSLVDGDSLFLVVLTDRMPSDVLSSLGTIFGRSVVRIFSKEVLSEEAIMMRASNAERDGSDFMPPLPRLPRKVMMVVPLLIAVLMGFWAILKPGVKGQKEGGDPTLPTNFPPGSVTWLTNFVRIWTYDIWTIDPANPDPNSTIWLTNSAPIWTIVPTNTVPNKTN